MLAVFGNQSASIAERAFDVITQTNSEKRNGMVEDLKLFQACKQVFLKQFSKRKLGTHIPPTSAEHDYVV